MGVTAAILVSILLLVALAIGLGVYLLLEKIYAVIVERRPAVSDRTRCFICGAAACGLCEICGRPTCYEHERRFQPIPSRCIECREAGLWMSLASIGAGVAAFIAGIVLAFPLLLAV